MSIVAGACPLVNYKYSGTQFSDAYGRSSYAEVHPDFVKYMNDMNSYASTCGVQVRDDFRFDFVLIERLHLLLKLIFQSLEYDKMAYLW